jgi:hypothetical protein
MKYANSILFILIFLSANCSIAHAVQDAGPNTLTVRHKPVPSVGSLVNQQEQDKEIQPAEATTATSGNKEEIGEREVRFVLWDGTVVTGDIGIEFLIVQTKFGKLEVPVKNIMSLRPGMDSFPQMTQEIAELVEKLGDRDFQTREKAHRALVAKGNLIRAEIENFKDGGSAERKKHLDKIREQIEEMADDEEEWEEDGEREPEMIRGDTIQTRDFTIVGKIIQPEFSLSSKYGNLRIALSDIKQGDRNWMQTTETINRNIAVQGNSFFQTKPVSTKIRVNKGDRIKIRASGTVQWASWGNISSGPGGITNQGNWNGHNCGTLLARIGEKGELIKIADKGEFVAKSNGVLFLGISMRDNYANQASYQWPGTYKARVSLTPAETATEEESGEDAESDEGKEAVEDAAGDAVDAAKDLIPEFK